MKKAEFSLRIRTWEQANFVTVWIGKRYAGTFAGLLWGEMRPELAEQLAEALGLPVERESQAVALSVIEPADVLGCVPVSEQQSLFLEDP